MTYKSAGNGHAKFLYPAFFELDCAHLRIPYAHLPNARSYYHLHTKRRRPCPTWQIDGLN